MQFTPCLPALPWAKPPSCSHGSSRAGAAEGQLPGTDKLRGKGMSTGELVGSGDPSALRELAGTGSQVMAGSCCQSHEHSSPHWDGDSILFSTKRE